MSSLRQLPEGFDPMYFMRVSSAIATLEQDQDTAPHMEYLRKAHQVFFGPAEGRTTNNLEQERVYVELYNDIRSHQDLWFRRIYANGVPMSYVFCEWTVGILGTLATIRRQRGDVAKCLEVLELDEQVLEQYQTLLTTIEGDEEFCQGNAKCMAGLTYKYNLIASNAHQQARNKEKCLKHFRAGARYEIEQKYNRDRQSLAFVIEARADNMEKDYMTVEFLDETPDDYIWSVLMAALQMSGNISPSKTVEPWICDGCGDEEEFCGDYKRCVSCRKAYYCSRACQVKHWKLHKPDCKKTSPKCTASMAQSIKSICKSTIRNYSEAVKAGTGGDVSEEHKKAAFPTMVQLARKYVLEHPRLSPDEAFAGAASDLQFRKQVDAFLEAQPGFEALNNPQNHRITDEQRLAFIAADQMEFYEDRLLEVARQTVGGMTPYFAALDIAPDAQELERACQHVVSTVKAYVSEHPEYQTPENFATAVRENKFENLIATALADYFNSLAEA